MVWTSINEKLRHLIKIFISYISYELNVNSIIKLSSLYAIISVLILTSVFL